MHGTRIVSLSAPRLALTLVALAALSAACSARSPTEGVEYKRNPTPKQTYRITMSVANAPGPLKLMSAGASYQADCAYLLNKLEGVMAYPEQHLPVTFDRTGMTTYQGTLHLDAIVDEEYFGNGVCHWQFVGFGATFRATGAPEETAFSPSATLDDITGEKPVTTYFWKGHYPREGIAGYPDSGRLNPEDFKAAVRDQLFSITIETRGVQE